MVSAPNSLRDLYVHFMNAKDISQLIQFLAAVLYPLGCDYFTFCGSSSGKFGPKLEDFGINFFYSNLPASFLAQIPNPMMHNVTVRRVLEQGIDSIWTDRSIWQDAKPVEIDLRNSFGTAGFMRGYTVGLSRQPGYYTWIGFHLDRLPEANFSRDLELIKPDLIAIAGVFDKVFLNNHINAHFSLSPRERDVLSWLAVGARPEEIALRLGIGAGSVDKYIVSAKEKLDARTRDHAVARALMLGLIDL